MELHQELRRVGLSDGESKVYLALTKLGTSPVSQIKEETKMHRTTIYDFLHQLLNKGLAHYVIKAGVKHYGATHPNKLLDFVKDKEAVVHAMMPELASLSEFHTSELNVEVYQGVEGVKSMMNDLLRHAKDYVIFGIDESIFKERLGAYMDRFFKRQKKLGFSERILTSVDATFVYEYETAHYRYLPKEQFNPTPTFVWGDNVGILTWEPFSVIRIKNPAVADSYKKYFELLWKQAKKLPKSAILKRKK